MEKSKPKTFTAINFGCRTNAAETNQLSQILLDHGFKPNKDSPGLILVNTCAITKKGEKESLQKIRSLKRNFPNSTVITTGCADLSSFEKEKNILVLKNKDKKKILKESGGDYQPQIKDKFSASKKYILKIQSGCNQYCTYCIVPYRRDKLWSLPIKKAIKDTKKAINNGYTHLIITGVNLELYEPGLDKLLKNLLQKTTIQEISYGSIPVNSITKDFLDLYKTYSKRLSSTIHIPIQSGSDKILKLMNRPYTRKQTEETIENCIKKIPNLKLQTDIIVGFLGEKEKDFKDTLSLLKKYPFQKIHTFRFSMRPQTAAEKLFEKYSLPTPQESKERSQVLRSIKINPC